MEHVGEVPASYPTGFFPDGDSRLLYNSDMGMFYDPAEGSFRDANTGLWYTFENGTWQLLGGT